jgi:hypothetical protein
MLERPAWIGVMLLASVALVAVLSVVPLLPTNDGAQHVLVGHIAAHYADPGADLYRAYLEPLPQFAESGFAALFVPLDGLLGWRAALRATLAVGLLGNAWAFAWLVRLLAPGRSIVGLLGFAFAFGWPLYMGFFPFVVASALGMLVVALTIRRAEPRAMDWVALAALLGAVAWMHAATAALTGIVVAVLVLARTPRGGHLGALARLVAVGLPALAVVAAATVAHAAPEAKGIRYPLLWTPLDVRLRELPRVLFPGPGWRSALGLAVVTAGLASAVARARRGALTGAERGVAGVAALFLLLAVVGPKHIPGWQFFSPRFVPFAVAMAAALVAVEDAPSPRARRAIGAAVALVAAASLAGTAAFHRRLWAGCADTYAGVDEPLHRTWFQLPILLGPKCGVDPDPTVSEMPYLSANLNAGALYATAHGGLTPYVFAGDPSIDAFRYRPGDATHPLPIRPEPTYWQTIGEPRFDEDPAFRAGVLARLAGYGAVYEDIVVVGGRPADLDAFVARGFVADYRGQSTLVARFRGCPIEVDVPRAAIDAPLTVEYGLVPVPEARWSRAFEPADLAGDGPSARVRVPQSACGDVWVRVAFRGAAHRYRCANAGADGRILATVRGSGVLACDAR